MALDTSSHRGVPDGSAIALSSRFKALSQSSSESLIRVVMDQLERIGKFPPQDEDEFDTFRLATLILEARWLKLRDVVAGLPPEILALIFFFVCDMNEFYPDLMPPPIKLSFVCRKWKDIVMSTPYLWSSWTVNFEVWRSDLERLERAVSTFISRSKTSPLSLNLDFMEDGYGAFTNKELQKIVAILGAIVQHSDRWQTVEFRIHPFSLHHPIFLPIIGRLSMLRKLHIVGVDEPDLFDEEFWLCNSGTQPLGTAPSLNHLSINGFTVVERGLVVPWGQIRTLELEAMYDAAVLTSVLALCPNAESLHLNGLDITSEPGEELADPVPPLPSVENLSARLSDVAHAFYHLNLPNLLSLELHGSINANGPSLKDVYIEPFLERSSCSITSLSLSTLPFSDREVISLLRMIPSLEQLRIREQHGWRWYRYEPEHRIITTLFWNSLATIAIVPRLCELKLVFYGGDLDGSALVDALTSRTNPRSNIACLKATTLEIGRDAPSDELKESLAGLRRDLALKKINLSVVYLPGDD